MLLYRWVVSSNGILRGRIRGWDQSEWIVPSEHKLFSNTSRFLYSRTEYGTIEFALATIPSLCVAVGRFVLAFYQIDWLSEYTPLMFYMLCMETGLLFSRVIGHLPGPEPCRRRPKVGSCITCLDASAR